ncbi:MAG: CBS domain-containing protein, partial [Clostridia bacterium]|nr:CBS domain-containing protein [Clostridia bacterium]
MNKKVSDIMTRDVYTLSENDAISTAAQIMKSEDIGFIPILRDRTLIGVVTDRDLVIRGYAKGYNADTKLKEVMTSSCVTVKSDATISEAADIMAEKQLRRLCVIDNGELAGICAIGDISVSRLGKAEAGQALSEISQP